MPNSHVQTQPIPYNNFYTTASPAHKAAFDKFIGQAAPCC